jgi:hypothetical protein
MSECTYYSTSLGRSCTAPDGHDGPHTFAAMEPIGAPPPDAVEGAHCRECGAPERDGYCTRPSSGAPDDMPCHPGEPPPEALEVARKILNVARGGAHPTSKLSVSAGGGPPAHRP